MSWGSPWLWKTAVLNLGPTGNSKLSRIIACHGHGNSKNLLAKSNGLNGSNVKGYTRSYLGKKNMVWEGIPLDSRCIEETEMINWSHFFCFFVVHIGTAFCCVFYGNFYRIFDSSVNGSLHGFFTM